MNRMSQDIENLEAELEELSQTAAPTEQDVAQMAELAAKLTDMRQVHEELELQWLDAAERAEAAK